MVTLTEETGGIVSLEFNQGETSVFHRDIFTDPGKTANADLTGYLARGMGRAQYGSLAAYPMLFSISCTISGNRVTCAIPPSESTAISVLSGVYDIEIYSATDAEIVYRVQQGTWTMNPEVTL